MKKHAQKEDIRKSYMEYIVHTVESARALLRGHYPLIMIRNLGIFLEHTNFNFPAFLHSFAPFLIIPTLVDAIHKGMGYNFSFLLYVHLNY